nr:ion channel [Sphingomicrobium nitratireducens]
MSTLLVTVCFFVHFVALRRLAHITSKPFAKIHHPLLIVLFALFALHLVEAMLYVAGFVYMHYSGFGHLTGIEGTEMNLLSDWFYFSMSAYTTLGIGDILPHGPIRIVAGVEALNGLVLIAWSASFTYLMMERFWTELSDD